jgi:hypothetical protein
MSYFKTRCAACGAEYMTGMVGKTLMGSHDCPKTADERHIAFMDEQKRTREIAENQRKANR